MNSQEIKDQEKENNDIIVIQSDSDIISEYEENEIIPNNKNKENSR